MECDGPLGTCVIGYSGTNISTATWTATGSGAYSATVNAYATYVLQNNVLDAYGHPTPLMVYSSLAALQASASNVGSFYDPTTAKLYVQQAGAVVTGANLRAIYASTSTSSYTLARTLWLGVKIGIMRVVWEGVYNDIAHDGTVQSEEYVKDSVYRYAGKALAEVQERLCESSLCLEQDVDAYNGSADNLSLKANGNGNSLGLQVNVRSVYAGDYFAFGSACPSNNTLNTSSGDNGNMMIVGGLYADGCGPNIPASFYGWFIGITTGYPSGVSNGGTNSAGVAASEGTTTIYCDTCTDLNGIQNSYRATLSGGLVYLKNPIRSQPDGGLGSVSAY
jgi:hypothetical protein